LVDSPSELPEGIHSVEGGCSAAAGSAGGASGIGSGMRCSTGGIGGGAVAAGLGGIFFFGPAFFFAIRFAFFFAPFFAFRFLAKQ
jgi:hypothetical protein